MVCNWTGKLSERDRLRIGLLDQNQMTEKIMTKCKLDRRLGTKQYYLVLCFFGFSVI